MLNHAEITTALKSIPWFFDLSPESINRLGSIADIVSFNPGNLLFSEGAQHPYLYVVLEGEVRLESFVPGRGTLPLFTAEALDMVGWSSITPVVRQMTCTATTLTSTTLLKFNAQALMSCCEEDCELGFIIMKRLANIVASRLLTHRLHLLEIISCQK